MSIVTQSYLWECSICYKMEIEKYQLYTTAHPMLPTIPKGWDVIFNRVICDDHKSILLTVDDTDIWIRKPL